MAIEENIENIINNTEKLIYINNAETRIYYFYFAPNSSSFTPNIINYYIIIMNNKLSSLV